MKTIKQALMSDIAGKTIAGVVSGSDQLTILFTDDTLLYVCGQCGYEGEHELTSCETFDPFWGNNLAAIELGIITHDEVNHYRELTRSLKHHEKANRLRAE